MLCGPSKSAKVGANPLKLGPVGVGANPLKLGAPLKSTIPLWKQETLHSITPYRIPRPVKNWVQDVFG